MASIRINLFGAPQVARDGALLAISRRKVLALLAFLARTGRAHSRDELLAFLWPDAEPGDARANLRRDLSRLKKWLGGTGLEISRAQVRLDANAQIWVDVNEFDARLDQVQAHAHPADELCPACLQALIDSVDLYKDHFMAGFGLPDSPAFDEWQFFEAESLRQQLASALQRLVGWLTRQREYASAIAYARRWLALDNLHEPAQRELMRLYALSGQQAAALRQYQECVRLLDQELGLEPELETTELYEAIRTRRFAPDSDLSANPPPTAASVDAPLTDPTLAASPVIRHNLPAQITPTLGRETELDQILASLRDNPDCRLLTLTGPGGSGKTRLAIQAGFLLDEEAGPPFPDGIWFVSLAPHADPDSLLTATAQALDFSFLGDSAQRRQQLLDFLSGRRLLLILDNFEHLVSEKAQTWVTDLLGVAPQVKVLATSRIRLNILGEQILAVSGLQVPEADQISDAPSGQGDLLSYSAIQLFLQAGKRLKLDFSLTADNHSAVARICRLVEGIPLGLELAAAWLDLLSPAEIAAEIERSLDFLEAEWADLPARQRSLRAVFNGSWQLLNTDERAAMKAVSVFPGSFTIQAAQAISGTSIKVLHALMHKSWLKNASGVRFQIHELLRQYTEEKLQADRAEVTDINKRYAAYYAAFLEEQPRLIRGPRQVEAYLDMGIEFENIRLAWNICIERLWLEMAVERMLPAIFFYCEARFRADDLHNLIDPALQILETGKPSLTQTRYVAILQIARASFFRNGYPVRFEAFGFFIPADESVIQKAWITAQQYEIAGELGFWSIYLAYLYGRIIERQTGAALLRTLADEFRRQGQDWELAFCLYSLGALLEVILYEDAGTPELRMEAERSLKEALSIFQTLGDQREGGNTQRTLGNLYLKIRADAETFHHWQAARSTLRQIGEWAVAAGISWQIGDLHLRIGEFEAAFEEYAGMSRTYRERGYPQIEAYSVSKESMEASRYGDIERASALRQRALEISRQTHDLYGEAWSSWELGEIYRISGDLISARTWFETAGRLFLQVEDQSGRIFYQRGLGELAMATGDYDQALSCFQVSLDWAKKLRHDWGAAYSLAGLGRAALRLDDFDHAQRYLLKSLDLAHAIDYPGLMLVALCGLAEYSAVINQPERAVRLAGLVAGHPLSWNETRTQAKGILGGISDLSPRRIIESNDDDREMGLLEVVRLILEEGFATGRSQI